MTDVRRPRQALKGCCEIERRTVLAQLESSRLGRHPAIMEIRDEMQGRHREFHVKSGPALIVPPTGRWRPLQEMSDLIPLIVPRLKPVGLRVLQLKEQRFRLRRAPALATPERSVSRARIHALQGLLPPR